MIGELSQAIRALRADRGSTAVSILSLALGIAITTCAYSELNGIVLRDVPSVTRPDRLITLETLVSFPSYERFAALTDVFESAGAYVAPVPFGVSISGNTERLWGHIVTSSYFGALGAGLAQGRYFRDDEPAVIISDRLWRDRFNRDPKVVGTALLVNGHPCTIAGVVAEGFAGASPLLFSADLWIPVGAAQAITPELASGYVHRRDKPIFQVIARLRPGLSLESAEAALDTAERQLEAMYGDGDRADPSRRIKVLPGGKLAPMRKERLPAVTGLLMLIAGMVLAIASANVGNIMLARAARRRKEIAIRLAIGAGRGRIVRQLLTECMLIAAAAGALGIVLTYVLMRMASRIRIPYPMPVRFDLTPDWRVLLFAAALSAATGLAFGLAPALQSARTDITPALRNSGERVRFRGLTMRNLFIVSQVVASVALVIVTAVLVLGYGRNVSASVGFDPSELSVLSVDPVRDGYSGPKAAATLERILERCRALPGIESVALTVSRPMSFYGGGSVSFSTGEGGTRTVRTATRMVVGRHYFEAMRIPVLNGRAFTRSDEVGGVRAVVVTQTVARNIADGNDVLGRRIEVRHERIAAFRFGSTIADHADGPATQVFEIVGVTKDARENLNLGESEARPLIYFPLRESDTMHPPMTGITLLLRGAPGTNALEAARREIDRIDRRLSVFEARSMSDQIEQVRYPFTLAAWTYGIVGLCGLVLACIGLAGVTAYSVARRRREIGIRIALGAKAANVLRFVMTEGVVLIAIGTVLGGALAYAGTRMIAAITAEAGKSIGNAPGAFVVGGAALGLAFIAAIACYVPARQATRVDPVAVLRAE